MSVTVRPTLVPVTRGVIARNPAFLGLWRKVTGYRYHIRCRNSRGLHLRGLACPTEKLAAAYSSSCRYFDIKPFVLAHTKHNKYRCRIPVLERLSLHRLWPKRPNRLFLGQENPELRKSRFVSLLEPTLGGEGRLLIPGGQIRQFSLVSCTKTPTISYFQLLLF